jgi:hypothetical protein
MVIKIPEKKTAVPKSPEDLFRSLRSRSPEIKNLWSQQADVLREYMKYIDERDVAFALPTGAGKTLVTLLIAEFRRLAKRERSVFLCPTRQLARQVGEQASRYDIPTVVLVGPQKYYPAADFGAYATASKIAISTYSGVFNTNPKLDNAQFIVCDDAHAAENYVAGFWALRIERRNHEEAYGAIIDILESGMPESFVAGLRAEHPTPNERDAVGMVLQPLLWERIDQLREAIAPRIVETDLRYSWSLLSERLNACNVFIARHEILIKPLSPPTHTHVPFANARQRLYVSATLGSPGELERMTGVRPIRRLGTPAGWEHKTPGRRLILVPNLCLAEDGSDEVVAQSITSTPRALVLSPDRGRTERLINALKTKGVDKLLLNAGDIDEGLDDFLVNDSVLMLAGRYEGIDLPDDSCRMLVIDGSPEATTLQERFLSQRLGATAVLRDRLATRITQALGRCTRNDRDYAVVLMVGGRLAHRIAEEEVKALLSPEIQAELAVGISNSGNGNPDDFVRMAKEFLADEKERATLDDYVAEQRDQFVTPKSKVAEVLSKTATKELEYSEAAWENNWKKAFAAASTVAEALSGGEELRPYRAFWLYLAGSAGCHVGTAHGDADLGSQGEKLLAQAYEVSSGISWFASALKDLEASRAGPKRDETDELAAESVAKRLLRFGQGPRFESFLAKVERLLGEKKPPQFHEGLQELGKLLGLDSLRPDPAAQGAPDAYWKSPTFVIVFEAKSEVDPAKRISISDSREVAGHASWIKEHDTPRRGTITPVLATYQKKADPNAKPHLQGVQYLEIKVLRSFAAGVFGALRKARQDAGRLGEAALASRLQQELGAVGALPSQLLVNLLSIPATKLCD